MHRRKENQYEALIRYDSDAKRSIATIGTLAIVTKNAYTFREELDTLQSNIRDNITAIVSTLEELQQKGEQFSANYKLGSDFNPLSYDREQLLALQSSFRKVLFKATQQLQKMELDELLRLSESDAKAGHNSDRLVDEADASLELTRDMTACARRLADEVNLGAMNAQLLEDSSAQITSNLSELKDMSGKLQQSDRLTGLANRRRVTSYVLFTLAFSFFFLSCLTIVLRRLPMGSWLLPSSLF